MMVLKTDYLFVSTKILHFLSFKYTHAAKKKETNKSEYDLYDLFKKSAPLGFNNNSPPVLFSYRIERSIIISHRQHCRKNGPI